MSDVGRVLADLTAALLARSDMRTIDGAQAPVCGLADLVAMKWRAGRPPDVDDPARLQLAHGDLPETT